jgi:hypothetical protein
MSKRQQAHHLSQAELLQAVVDTRELPRERRLHLEQCPTCTPALAALQSNLGRLGRRARDLTPAPGRPFRLPDRVRAPWMRRWVPMWLVGAMAAILLAVSVWAPSWWAWDEAPQVASSTTAADNQLLDDVDALVANALPADYQDLAFLAFPVQAFDMDVDDDMLDWVVPSIDDEDLLT